jgi:hypothetical protein
VGGETSVAVKTSVRTCRVRADTETREHLNTKHSIDIVRELESSLCDTG